MAEEPHQTRNISMNVKHAMNPSPRGSRLLPRRAAINGPKEGAWSEFLTAQDALDFAHKYNKDNGEAEEDDDTIIGRIVNSAFEPRDAYGSFWGAWTVAGVINDHEKRIRQLEQAAPHVTPPHAPHARRRHTPATRHTPAAATRPPHARRTAPHQVQELHRVEFEKLNARMKIHDAHMASISQEVGRVQNRAWKQGQDVARSLQMVSKALATSGQAFNLASKNTDNVSQSLPSPHCIPIAHCISIACRPHCIPICA